VFEEVGRGRGWVFGVLFLKVFGFEGVVFLLE